MLTTQPEDKIPERFKGVKLTKAGKPDTRSKLGREYADWLHAVYGDVNPENFAAEGQDAPNPSQPTQTTESAPVSEKTALEPDVNGDERFPAPKPGTHDAAKWLVERMVEFYPDLKRGDWTLMAVTFQLAMRHNQHWFKLKTAQQESQG